MFVYALEFEREAELEQALRRLERHYELTGEFHVQPVDGGRAWRLTVYAERALRDSVLEKLGGRRVDATP